MWPITANRLSFMIWNLPVYTDTAVFQNAFATPDGKPPQSWPSLCVTDVSRNLDAFTVIMFAVVELNLPYIEVDRKGDIDLPIGGQQRSVQLESIDFTDRFDIGAFDPRSAVMLIDQGMMQWLLDCERVSFRIMGPLVTAFVRRRGSTSAEPTELELLFRFHDQFASHIPELVHSEFPAPTPQSRT